METGASAEELPSDPMEENSSHWRYWLILPWATALAAGLVLAAMRVVGVLGPAQWRWLLPMGFVVMAALPWLVMTRPGRRSIGLRRGTDWRFYALALATGCVAALVCGLLGLALFGVDSDNWFLSIANSYRNTLDTRGLALWQLHLFFTLPACLFSPIGEEIFFRGLLHGALQERFGARVAAVSEAGLFGLVHVCHHGLWMAATGWAFRPESGVLWMLLMFGTALVFSALRQRSKSLGPPILAHAMFNATMNTFIFAKLW
jgi:membrane protease YdiL (CAAX protease family)